MENKEVICPYCGTQQSFHWNILPYNIGTKKCENCGKLFAYTVKIEKTYFSIKLKEKVNKQSKSN
jgi:uncharacterized Zn finger protein